MTGSAVARDARPDGDGSAGTSPQINPDDYLDPDAEAYADYVADQWLGLQEDEMREAEARWRDRIGGTGGSQDEADQGDWIYEDWREAR